LTDPRVSWAESLAEAAAPAADEPVSRAVPITRSRADWSRLRIAALRRSTTALGLTRSCRASTFDDSDRRVSAISSLSSSVL
jgi:hypothetical protein